MQLLQMQQRANVNMKAWQQQQQLNAGSSLDQQILAARVDALAARSASSEGRASSGGAAQGVITAQQRGLARQILLRANAFLRGQFEEAVAAAEQGEPQRLLGLLATAESIAAQSGSSRGSGSAGGRSCSGSNGVGGSRAASRGSSTGEMMISTNSNSRAAAATSAPAGTKDTMASSMAAAATALANHQQPPTPLGASELQRLVEEAEAEVNGYQCRAVELRDAQNMDAALEALRQLKRARDRAAELRRQISTLAATPPAV